MATVLNRSTKEIRKSVNTPDYPVDAWIRNPDLSEVEGVDPKYWKISGDLVQEMSQAEKDVVDASELDEYKAAKIAKIDARTAELVMAGFPFDGQNFSMSEAAQRNWAGMGAVLGLGLLPFPLPISTVDEGTYILNDSQHCLQFIGAYMLYQADPNQPLGAGRALKAQVNAATTKAEVDAVEDNR